MKNGKSTASAPAPARDLLIVVHPGSLCGSANFNLGKIQADYAVQALIPEPERADAPGA